MYTPEYTPNGMDLTHHKTPVAQTITEQHLGKWFAFMNDEAQSHYPLMMQTHYIIAIYIRIPLNRAQPSRRSVSRFAINPPPILAGCAIAVHHLTSLSNATFA